LTQIKPTIAPSLWHLEFYPVFCGDSTVDDLYVVELFVPAGPQNNSVLYTTNSGEVFIKTHSGKHKLSEEEIKQELLTRHERRKKGSIKQSTHHQIDTWLQLLKFRCRRRNKSRCMASRQQSRLGVMMVIPSRPHRRGLFQVAPQVFSRPSFPFGWSLAALALG